MDTGTVNAPEWLNPELLAQFMDELREAGYNIGVEQYIAVQDLLLTLTAQGEIHELRQLKTLIGPIVCSSSAEQTDFQHRFDQWAELVSQRQYSPPITPEQQAEDLSEVLDTLRSQSTWLKRILMATVTVLTVVFFYIPDEIPDTSRETRLLELGDSQSTTPSTELTPESAVGLVPEPEPDPESEFAYPAFKLDWKIIYLLPPPLAFAIWRMWWRWRARLFLNRQGSGQTPELQKISMQSFETALFAPALISQMAQQLRHRTRKLANTLDIDNTIRASLQRGGWLTPVYGYRKVVPEYVFLIDWVSYHDHQAKLTEELIKHLQQNGVYITCYFFDSDAQICYPNSQSNAPQSLQTIANKYVNDRLVVVAEAEIFYSPHTGKPEPWVEQIQAWEKQAILTPKPFEHWGQWESRLVHQFVVLPLTTQGIEALAQVFRDSSAFYRFAGKSQVPFPGILSARPQRWLERNPPSPEESRKMVAELRAYLGETGFYWFAACAVFPKLDWNITIYLGNALKTSKGQSLLEMCSVTDMTRLPWFRYGYMPDWLRDRLISSLTQEQEHTVRNALQELLITAVQGSTSDLQLEIAKQNNRFLPRLVNPLLSLLSKRVPADNPLRDYIFLGFMIGAPKLGITIPNGLVNILQKPRGFRWLIDRGVVGWKRQLRQWLPTIQEAITFGVILTLSVMPDVQYPLFDLRTLIQANYRHLTNQLPSNETPLPTQPSVSLIAIDQASIDQEQSNRSEVGLEPIMTWPIDRTYLARLISQLSDMDAKVVGIDFFIDTQQLGEEQLAKALQSAVEEKNSWFILAGSNTDGRQVRDQVASPNWSLRGDIGFYKWDVKLPNDSTCLDLCPFGYLLTLANTLNQQTTAPQPNLQSQTDFQLEISAYIREQQRLNQDNAVSLLTRAHPPFGLRSIIDFSVPPEQAYKIISAQALLSEPLSNQNLQQNIKQSVVIIASGGYAGASDNFTVPPAIAYWCHARRIAEPQRKNCPEVFTGGEVHAYMVHQLLSSRRVVQIPDWWMVFAAALLGKWATLTLAQQQVNQRQQYVFIFAVVTAYYGLVGLQAYISEDVLIPWLFPSGMFWTYAIESVKKKSMTSHI